MSGLFGMGCDKRNIDVLNRLAGGRRSNIYGFFPSNIAQPGTKPPPQAWRAPERLGRLFCGVCNILHAAFSCAGNPPITSRSNCIQTPAPEPHGSSLNDDPPP